MQAQSQAEAWQFAQFRLEPKRRVLVANGATVVLSSRAFDILEFLVANRDRVVTRDEIVAHVWRGVNVGENNLAVQLSGLRRALAEHCGGETLIVSLPGRGYRFVADVSLTIEMPGTSEALSDRHSTAPPTIGLPSPDSRRWRRPAMLCACLGAVLLFIVVAWRNGGPFASSSVSRPEARLSIAVHRLTPIGDDPRTSALAASYTDSILARFGIFEDLSLFPRSENSGSGFSPHFDLTGTVQIVGTNTVVTAGILETASGRLLYRDILTVPAVSSAADRFATAMHLLLDIRPLLFTVEFARKTGPPRDALDYLIAAHVALGEQDQISELRHALALAEQAVARDPANRPARVLLSLLLTEDLSSTSALRGDAEGERALALIDGVLLEQPRNFLYVARRAYTLEALKRLDEAEATADLGLKIEPGYWFLTQKLSEILLLKGQVMKARTLLEASPDDAHDDMPATLAFAEGRYGDALALTRQVVTAAPTDWFTQFTSMLEVATLCELGNRQEAHSILARTLSLMPAELRTVSAQRQALYVLPDEAWQRFKQSLADAGMPP